MLFENACAFAGEIQRPGCRTRTWQPHDHGNFRAMSLASRSATFKGVEEAGPLPSAGGRWRASSRCLGCGNGHI